MTSLWRHNYQNLQYLPYFESYGVHILYVLTWNPSGIIQIENKTFRKFLGVATGGGGFLNIEKFRKFDFFLFFPDCF